MVDTKRFLKIKRQKTKYRPVCERTKDYKEVAFLRSQPESEQQASRCMDCGTPFCQWGCPLGNYIPEWNDLVHHAQWQKALELLRATNNLPEITGRLCPALCEYSCVLGYNDDPVTIRENELGIVEHAFISGVIKPRIPKMRTGKKIAIVGSGPAGLACADQLNQAGHLVTVFEKDSTPGGLLRYGIPDFKLDKNIIDRRLEILKQEGIIFVNNTHVGVDYEVKKLIRDFSAVCLTGGSRVPRDLKIEGRELKGIHFALDYLVQANRMAQGKAIPADKLIDVRNKKVVVIGGGDTGADCVGTAHRQGAACVTQIELMPKPPLERTCEYPWPKYPMILKTSTSHEEGGLREWSVLTKKFVGQEGKLQKLSCVRAEFVKKDKCSTIQEIAGTKFEIDTDVVILALGFLQPEHNGLLDELGVDFDARGNVKTDASYMTKVKGIFSAGDMRRGQSLIVWAISEGRIAAHHIDKYLMGETNLPSH